MFSRLARGWAGDPLQPRPIRLTSQRTPLSRRAGIDAPCLITHWSNRNLCLSSESCLLNDDRLAVMHQPVDQGRGQGVVRVEQGAPFPEGSIRGEHDRSGFITGRNHLEQQVGPALVDRQIAQLIEKEKSGTDISLDGFAQQTVDLRGGEMIDHVTTRVWRTEKPRSAAV